MYGYTTGNLLAAANVVKEYSRDILNWVEETAQYFSDQKTGEKYGSLVFYHFVSALAWMELYDIELMVLKKLVDLKVQLWEDAQERLKFLSSGWYSKRTDLYACRKCLFV